MSELNFPGGPGRELRVPAAEEIAWAPTAAGELSLRRWPQSDGRSPALEITLNGACLTSSRFAAGAAELVRRALAPLAGDAWDVMVGGLGLGLTAAAVLDDPRVAALFVFEATPEVVEWSRTGLVPHGVRVAADRRTRFIGADWTEVLGSGRPDPERRRPQFDAVIIDVTRSSRRAPAAAGAPTTPIVRDVADALRPGGVFAMWSDLPPDTDLLQILRAVFVDVVARPLAFEDPAQGMLGVHTLYIARLTGPTG